MKITDIFKIINNKGLSWTLFRLTYEIKTKTGILKKSFPTREMSDDEVLDKIVGLSSNTKAALVSQIRTNLKSFFVSYKDLDKYREFLIQSLTQDERENIIYIADNAIEGKIPCFSKWEADFGNPINWHINPVTKYEWDSSKHWVDLEELSSSAGDVKYVWEASRFPHFYYFARAYAITKDEKYALAYWEQVENWIEDNPYNIGINWKCGQEIAIRMYAWIFCLYIFLDTKHSTNERIFKLVKNLYLSALRIEGNINFARKAVQNNHAISEAAGLFSFGVLFPYFRDSNRLKNKGKLYLEQEGLKQIFDDGSYIQNSVNYQRLMLQTYSWCYCLAQRNNITFNSQLTSKIKKSINLLYQMQDELTGQLPNYGSNDGALIFPLTSCDYLNYKPQLNSIFYIISGQKLYDEGKHEEEMLWFCGDDAVKNADKTLIERKTNSFKIGGYHILRNNFGFGMIKCGIHKKTAGPADMLHFDFWYNGVNVLCDIGSYSYNPEDKFKGYFKATQNHNTITIDEKNQTKNGPRFLTIDWPNGYVRQFDEQNNSDNKSDMFFSGYHDGYNNTHTREIEFYDNYLLIKDKIENRKEDKLRVKLNWNVGTSVDKIRDNEFKLNVNQEEALTMQINSLTRGDFNLYYANEEIPKGWRSLYYGERIPCYQLVYEIKSTKPIEIIETRIYK
ncbi:alginate lyase family protein [Natranaerobius thermophilus]|uniref:Heparinase II/III family protein n=1 Tax=Natranaerobius thermophilus (strain ATCC BAA-1301 / DSM 18059 / JW/NM-WN-LF) TaxID=457570 RepID=B2A193_NATTJ|nr:alginate lyase family protein [Natranaerobius thermophilus]ACB86087.1 Heparinase II/III family protein [Natranaerobius thermophilus JW/NM-WN-LF]